MGLDQDFFGMPSYEHVHTLPKVYIIELAAPGFQKNDFNIELEDEVLTISLDIEIDVKNINYTRREFNYNSFKRAFNLPESANSSKIAANYESGVLKINI